LPSWALWIEPTTGIEPFDRLVVQVMTTQPYASAERVFWIVDNGSSHWSDLDRLSRRLDDKEQLTKAA
jgi:hypothetical protein